MTQPLRPSDHERNRRNDWRIGKWNVVAILLAALIAGSAGIGGGALGARIQGDQGRTQAREDFLRNQRQVLYGQYLSQSDDTYTAAYELVGNVIIVDTATIRTTLSAVAARQRTLNNLLAQIQMIGSDDAYDHAKALQRDISIIMSAGQTKDKAKISTALQVASKLSESDRESFVQAGKKNLG